MNIKCVLGPEVILKQWPIDNICDTLVTIGVRSDLILAVTG